MPIASEAFHLPQRRELSELFKGLKNDCACKRNAKKCLFYGPKKADKCLVVLIMMGLQPKYGHHPKFTREKKKIRSSRRRVVARVDEIIKPYDSSRHFHYNFQDGQQRRSAQYKGIFWVQIIKLLLSERALNTELSDSWYWHFVWLVVVHELWYMWFAF